MKRISIIFLLAALLLTLVCVSPAVFAASGGQIVSAYYGINTADGLIGQIAPGTSAETVYSRVIGDGTLALSKGVATGSNLTLTADGKQVDSLTLVVQADCSGDGAFSITDALQIKSYLLNQLKFSTAQIQAGDVSGDNKVTITDFLQMKSKLLKLGEFSLHQIAGAKSHNSVLLTPGQTFNFGPEDGVALKPGETLPEPTEPSVPEETVPETTEETVPETTEETVPETTEETVPETTEETVPETTEETVPETTDETVPETTGETIPEATGETVPETTGETVPETTGETVPETSEEIVETVETVLVEGDAVTWDNGIITAVKAGTARLTWGNETLIVTVCKDPLSVSFASSSLLLDPKQTYQLQPIVNHPVKTTITYTSSNSAVVTVDASGKLTAVKEGTAKITAKLPNGSSATIDVRVLPMIKTITMADDYVKVKNGSTKTLSVTIAPANATEKLIWKSSDTSIATVDENGVVTGKKNGTVTITCTSQYGKVSASCTVKVCNLIQVALTFDDGPSSAYTGKVLDMLEKYDAKATFFMVGNRITSKTKPLVKRMVEDGHELGYHTMAHTFFFRMNAKTIKADFEEFQSIVKGATGGVGATVYRAPGGNITQEALDTIPYPHIKWSVDTRDWEHRDPALVKQYIINGLKDGAIILVHDIHGTTYTGTLAALKQIREKDMDVEFLTVTELLSRKGTAPSAGKTYYNGK